MSDEAKDERAPSERRVRGAGLDLAIQERGPKDAPTIVLVHGFPDDHHVWDGVAESLAERHHVVTYDVRGVGASERPQSIEEYRLRLLAADLRAVIDAVSPEKKVHLVGHDWGSIQAWEAVTDEGHGARIASYTSISGPCLDHIGFWMRQTKSLLSLQAFRSWYVYAFHLPQLPEMFWRSATATRLWPKLLERIEGVTGDVSPSFGDDAARSVNLYRANILRAVRSPRKRYAQMPVNILAPRGDRYVSPALARAAEPWVRDLSFREIDGSHWIVRQQPRAVAAWIGDFAAENG